MSMFSPSLPTLQVAWDSTSLGVLKECPKKYFYQYICGRQSTGGSIHLSFGIAFHKAIEIYHIARVRDDFDHESALFESVKYCLTFPGTYEENPNKNRETLTRTIVWYFEQYKDDQAKVIRLANGLPAVELSFKLEMVDFNIRTPENEPFLLCGHLDTLVEFQDRIFFSDHKTTKGSLNHQYFSQFSPSNQMALYDFASQVISPEPVAGGIINAAQILVNSSRFGRHLLYRTEEQRIEFLVETQYYISQAIRFAEDNYYPMNDKACGNYGGCAYQSICSKSPSVRATFLSDDGTFVSSIWNPLEIRGDI